MLRPSVPVVLADGKTHALRFDLNAICALEDAWGISIGELAQRLSGTKGVRLSDIRTLLWAALYHERPRLTQEDVGDLIDLANLGTLSEQLRAAFEVAFPADEGKPKNAPGPGDSQGESQN